MIKLVWILVVISSITFGQNVDSLRFNYVNATGKAKIDALYDLIKVIRHDNAKEGLTYLNEGLNYAVKLKYNSGYAKLLSMFSYCYVNQGDLFKALEYAKKGLDIAKNTGKSSIIAEAENIIGICYYFIGTYDIALEHLLKSYTIRKSLNNISEIANTTNNLGLVYNKVGKLQLALDYFLISANLKKTIGDNDGLVRTLTNICDVYLIMGNIDESLKYQQQAEVLSTKIKFLSGIAIVDNLAGNIYRKLKQYKKALDYYNKSKNIYILKNEKLGVVQALNNIAEIKLDLNDIKGAESALLEANNLNDEIKSKEGLITTFNLLSILYEKKHNYQNALFYHKKYTELKDFIYNEQKSKQITELHLNYEIADKEKQISLLKKEKTIRNLAYDKELYQKNLYLIISMFLFIIGFLFIRKTAQLNKAKKLLERMNDAINLQNNKLEDLIKTKDTLFRIIAHDLRNPFNVLIGFSDSLLQYWDELIENEKKNLVIDINEVAKNSHYLLENLLQWSLAQTQNTNYKPIKLDLLTVINECLIHVQKNASIKNINILIDINQTVYVKSDKNILTTIIRNFLSNAIKFTNKGGNVWIYYTDLENFIELHIKDDGIGMDKESIFNKTSKIDFETTYGTLNEKGSGLGLVISKELIEKNGGIFKIESKPDFGSTFSFTIQKFKGEKE
ncbi:MAG: tetratricopeptide repeat-containing sensor histidine kinase [bacterium]